ncbi:hypothetical protein AX774_g1159 [Zancudomyces culisetae]|uniref:Uncharacterized protein n=1 Tax=Zancudomyces culisetae TaxID=1213189 RepID=A0A1R1PWF2_ZANCU|nr:hypothetical protein AX774_g1159 [Zancudomyces culisetae]|eukprot:OMH85281.1 hypothetical protein AX774_g1159 [Zancudomyces culisetae]
MAEEGAGLDGGGSKKQRFSLSDYKNKRGTSAGTGASSEAKRDEKFETKAELDDIHQILRGKGMENEEEEEIEREGRMRERPQTPNSNSIEGDWGQGTEMMDVEERGGEEMDELNEERDDNYMAEGSGGWGEDEKREEWVLDTSGDPEQERYDNVSRADTIRAKSRSRYINVYHKFFHDSRERVVEIIGTPASLRKAVLQICRRIEGFLTQDQRDTPLYSPKRNGLREFLLNQGASERSINLVYTNKQTPMAADSHSSASYHNSSSNQNQTSYSERRSSDRHTSAALPSTSSARNSSYQNQNRSSPTHYSPPPHNSSSSWSNAH